MKRKTTTLEQRLINSGYRLSHKQYGGRHSEKTLSYYYVKENQFVRLDYKREMVLGLGLLNYQCRELTRMELEGLKIAIYNIEQDIKEDKIVVPPTMRVSDYKGKEENDDTIPLEELEETYKEE